MAHEFLCRGARVRVHSDGRVEVLSDPAVCYCPYVEAAYGVDPLLSGSLGQLEGAEAPVDHQDVVGGLRERHLGEQLSPQLHRGSLLEVKQPSQEESPKAMGALLKEVADHHQPVAFEEAALSSLSVRPPVEQHSFNGLGVDLLQIG